MREPFRKFILLTVTMLAVALGQTGVVVAQAQSPIRVAVFEGPGVGSSVNALLDSLSGKHPTPLKVRRITAEEIRNGHLDEVDVLVQPGGSGSRQGKALGTEGRQAVVEFVRDGGGYLGVCAGCYLATNDYDWSLHLIDAKVVDRKHWARGTGAVRLRLSPAARTFFGDLPEQIEVHYGQGPLLGRREWDREETPDYESLALYESEIAEKGAPAGVMRGTSAIVRSLYGNGRVFCFSPHPELTDGYEFMIRDAVDWLSKMEPVPVVETAKEELVVP